MAYSNCKDGGRLHDNEICLVPTCANSDGIERPSRLAQGRGAHSTVLSNVRSMYRASRPSILFER